MVVGCFAPDEERLVLLKLVVQFSFYLMVYQEVFHIFNCTLSTSFFIYCGINAASGDRFVNERTIRRRSAKFEIGDENLTNEDRGRPENVVNIKFYEQ